MITSSDRRARCTREDRVVRRQDKARARGVNGVHEILREIVENPAVDKVRDEYRFHIRDQKDFRRS